MVGGTFLHARRSSISAFVNGRVHRAAGGFASTLRVTRVDRQAACRKIDGESMVRIPRVDFTGGLRRVRARLHRGRDVPRAGAATQDAPFTFDFLSSSAADGSFRGDHTITLVGIRSLHARIGQWIFCRRTTAMDPNQLRDRRLDSLWINPAGTILPLVCAQASGCTLHHRFQRGLDSSLGNHIHGPNAYAMNLFCVGLSHHNADVETRENFAGHAETDRVLRNCGCNEALLLSTCNRVEVYAAAEKFVPTEHIARCLARTHAVKLDGHVETFYRYEAGDCVRHLFRVASGLDSMVVGETEILGQAKKAYEAARMAGAAGRYLHRLFQRAFRVAKQVRTHTEITRGAVSVGSVAVDLAQKIFGDLRGCRVLVLGAGETSERTVRALVSRGVADLRVSNRSPERAKALSLAFNGRAVAFEQWPEQCAEIDILITSTSSDSPLLSQDKLAPLLRHRIDRPLFVIDIAVPRDVEPDVNALDGVYLYDIDSLQSIAEQSLATRRGQITAAEQIISQHVAEFGQLIARGLNYRPKASEHPTVGEGSLRVSEL